MNAASLLLNPLSTLQPLVSLNGQQTPTFPKTLREIAFLDGMFYFTKFT